jgi:hypothetical protein
MRRTPLLIVVGLVVAPVAAQGCSGSSSGVKSVDGGPTDGSLFHDGPPSDGTTASETGSSSGGSSGGSSGSSGSSGSGSGAEAGPPTGNYLVTPGTEGTVVAWLVDNGVLTASAPVIPRPAAPSPAACASTASGNYCFVGDYGNGSITTLVLTQPDTLTANGATVTMPGATASLSAIS